MDPLPSIGFLHTLIMASDSSRVYERAAMLLVSCFGKNTAPAALTEPLSSKSRWMHGSVKNGMLTCYVQAGNYFLGTYATDNLIAEPHGEIVRFTPQTNMPALQYGDGP